MRKKTGQLIKNGTGLGVIIPNEWIKELKLSKHSDVEKILHNGLIIISPKKVSGKKIEETINGLEKVVKVESRPQTVQLFSSPKKVATSEQEEYKTGPIRVLDINFNQEEKFTIKTAFLYAEKEGLMVPEKYSSNQEILGLLERAFNKCTFPGELSEKVQKILKKYGK